MSSKQILRAHNVQGVTAAALDLFYKNGVDNTTVNEIASVAGVSKMSVFRYFDTKGDIVRAATRELFKTVNFEFSKRVFTVDANDLTGMKLIQNYLAIYPHLLENRPQFLNYLCDVELFYSKHGIVYPRDDGDTLMSKYWDMAIEKGVADGSIVAQAGYRQTHNTIYSLFKGLCLAMYVKCKDLTIEDSKEDLGVQTECVISMIIKYLTPTGA